MRRSAVKNQLAQRGNRNDREMAGIRDEMVARHSDFRGAARWVISARGSPHQRRWHASAPSDLSSNQAKIDPTRTGGQEEAEATTEMVAEEVIDLDQDGVIFIGEPWIRMILHPVSG